MRRIIILGTGTSVGKTWVACALARALRGAFPDQPVLATKPIETGSEAPSSSVGTGRSSDAARLEAVTAGCHPPPQHPRYAFPEPLSPHLAARRAGSSIHLERIVEWLALAESAAAESRVRSGKDLHSAAPRTTQRPTRASGWSIVETAGGVFTPLEPGITNFELAVSLEPSFWILVARDALGTLHDVRVTLLAMNSYNRMPDAVLLSAGRSFDESTGTNADELRNLRIANPVCALGPNEDRSLDELVALLGRQAR